MNNTIFQSEKIHDKVSVEDNSKVYTAYQKSAVTTKKGHVTGKLV